MLLGIVAVVSVIGDLGRPANRETQLLAGAQIPQEVRLIIDKACRDCHSDATRFPWYSYVAPVSWLIDNDIRRGREHLNFSNWSEYPLVRRERCLSEIANQVQDGGMPLPVYLLIHRGAKLSRTEIQEIFDWTQAERLRLIEQSVALRNPK